MDNIRLEDQVRALVEELVDRGPIFLVDFSVRGRSGSHAVDVFVESDEALGVNQLAELSREIEFSLDTGEVMPGNYSLNVSTPGADRPLRLPRQYHKHLGRNLRVHYRKAEDVSTEVCGELIAAEDSSIQIDYGKGSLEILYKDIQWAKVQLPW